MLQAALSGEVRRVNTLAQVMEVLPHTGVVVWLGLRPARRADVDVVASAMAEKSVGLRGDRYARHGGDRQVTLIQAEHIDAMASMLAVRRIDPRVLRRNIVVRGLNLLALKGKRFRIGNALLAYSGLCHPCTRMEEALGPGGYNAMRGHGGITARVIETGEIATGSVVLAAGREPG